ncbi:MAG: MarR family winged helix-turn-helix transcriptional regulator [Leptospirales bacterium]|nr:MarR family winged helix-turn-helix transcriptional regulator [Leptospirales bacterium]
MKARVATRSQAQSASRRLPLRKQLIQDGLSCLNLNLQRAARGVAAHFDRALAPAGLSSNRFSVLMALGAADYFTLRNLAQTLALDRTTLIRNLLPLQELGLVEDLAPGLRKERRIALSEGGRRSLERSYPLWLEAHRQMQELLGGESYRQLLRKLRKVAAQAGDASRRRQSAATAP